MLAQQLIDAAVASGREGVVEVNQRDLVDKMLARYSSEHVVLRELLQNADDARASHVEFRFTTAATESGPSHTGRASSKGGELVTELREINNGNLFSEEDWTRVARIAEGNPSEDSVGMFGVGFYSVFSLTESPLVASGDACLAFKWAGVKLATFRSSLPPSEALAFTSLPAPAASVLSCAKPSPATTAVMLPMREPRAWDLTDLHTFFLRAMSFISRVQRVVVVKDGVVQFVVDRTDAPIPSKPRSKPGKSTLISSSSGLFRADTLAVASRRVRLWTPMKLTTVSLVHASAVLTVHADSEFRTKCARILKKQLPTRTTIQLLFTDAAHSVDAVSKALLPFTQALKPAGRVFIGLSTHQSTGTAFHCHAQLVPTVERENIDFQDPYLGRWNAELLECVGRAARVHYNDAVSSWASQKHTLQPWFQPYDSSSVPALSPSELAVLSSCLLEDSHPSLKVSQHLRDGFFADSPVPVITSSGLTPCDRVFLPSHGLEAFMWQSGLSSTPIVSSLLCSLSPGFSKQLLEHGAQQLSVDGLKLWATDAVLQPQQLVALLTWLSGAGKKMLKAEAARDVLARVTFVSSDARPIPWHCVKYFASGLHPTLPVPDSTLPSDVTMSLSPSELTRLGLKPLPIKSWLKLVEKRFGDVFGSPLSAGHALSYLSQCMGGFTAPDWQAVTRVLSDANCIPCSVRNKTSVCVKPCDAWFVPKGAEAPDASAPVIALNVIDSDAMSSSALDHSEEDDALFDVEEEGISAATRAQSVHQPANVSFEFLKRLGVKRVSTVGPLLSELRSATNTFQRLSALKAIASQWHGLKDVERHEISSSPCLPAMLDDGSTSVTLQPPNSIMFPSVVKDIRQSAKGHTMLPVVHLPELSLRPGSEHFAVLKLLGVRECPPLADMLRLCTARDGLGLCAVRYFLSHLRSHYSGVPVQDDKYVVKKVTLAFLPCSNQRSSSHPCKAVKKRGQKRGAAVVDLTDDDPCDGMTWEQACMIAVDAYATPTDVFESPNPFGPCLHPAVRLALAESDVTAAELGVKPFPTADSVLQLVTKQPPSTLDDAITLMTAIQRHCTGLTAAMYTKFGATAFLPINGCFVCPKDVFVATDEASGTLENGAVAVKPVAKKPAKRRALRQLPTNTDDLDGMDDVASIAVDHSLPSPDELRGLVHFLDAGSDGNAFLVSCGAASQPSATQLARALVMNFPAYLAAQPADSFVQRLVKVLQLIGSRYQELPASVKAELKSSLQLPAMRGGSGSSTEPVVFKHASELYLVDDPSLEAVVRPYIPVSGDLYKVCGLLGCKWLSAAVTQEPNVSSQPEVTPLAAALRDRILSRSELMVRNHRGELLNGLKPDALSWLKTVKVMETSGIQMRLSFEGKKFALSGAQAITTCVTLPASGLKAKSVSPTLCFVRDSAVAGPGSHSSEDATLAGVALYDVASELAKGLFVEDDCLSRLPGLDFVLSSPLALLRRRGVPVDRFVAASSDSSRPFVGRPVHAPAPTAAVDVGDDDDDVVEESAPHHPHKRRPAFVPEVESSRDVSQLLKCSAPSGAGSTSRVRVRQQEAEDDDCDVDIDLVPVAVGRAFPVHFMTTNDAKAYLSPAVLAAASVFGTMLSALAKDVFHMSNTRGIVLFADVDHPLIAFNRQGTLYFSLRYFVQCHTRLAWVKEGCAKYNGLLSKASVQTELVPTFWFVMFCHELAHNGVTEHNCRFNSLQEALFVSHDASFHAHQPALCNALKTSMEEVYGA